MRYEMELLPVKCEIFFYDIKIYFLLPILQRKNYK